MAFRTRTCLRSTTTAYPRPIHRCGPSTTLAYCQWAPYPASHAGPRIFSPRRPARVIGFVCPIRKNVLFQYEVWSPPHAVAFKSTVAVVHISCNGSIPTFNIPPLLFIPSAVMSFVNRPLKRELSRLVSNPFIYSARASSQSHGLVQGPISPEIDSMLDELYQALDDPTFQGDPTEFLLRIDEMWGEHDPKDKLEEYPGLEEMEPDPGMFPEDTDFDIAALLTPETLDVDLLSCFNNSKYLRRMMVSQPTTLCH